MPRTDGARLAAYRRNYERIARTHIDSWREGNGNPFQADYELRANEDLTLALFQKYAPPDPSVLDAGCGMGDLLLHLPRGSQGIDISKEYIAVAKERGLDVREGRIEKLPWPRETFDVVIATDVLEHVLDIHRAVKELLRVLREGGILLVRCPNEENMNAYVDYNDYEFVHLRSISDSFLRLLFIKVFDCEVLETQAPLNTIHAVMRK